MVKVGDADVSDWPLSRVADRIAGQNGTTIGLTLEDPRTGQQRSLLVTRSSIVLHQVSWCRLPGTGVIHLRIAAFDHGVTRDLRAALRNIQAGNADGIILDLRNNPGGLLTEAIGVASQFLGSGDVMQARDGHGQTQAVPVEKGGLCLQAPLVVLVNEGSASAAEIVAGALQDADRAPLVGTVTFGTGTVLRQFNLSDGSALLLAIEEWLTPKGRSFWHKGLTPDVKVALEPQVSILFPNTARGMAPSDLQASADRQLLTALRMLSRASKYSLAPGREPVHK